MIQGLERIHLSPYSDDRGSFTRLYQPDFWEEFHPDFEVKNVNLSVNPKKGTLRGFHYSVSPRLEHKVFHCISGAIHNMTVDVRPGSPNFGEVQVNVLSAEQNEALFVPGGCANAWLTLQDNTKVLYLVGSNYEPEFERGFRYDDAVVRAKWPFEPKLMSNKDQSWPEFQS